MILLIGFFFLFFRQVVVQYSEELTNTAKTVQKADKIEMPTFTICSGFKKSLFTEYNISPTIFSFHPWKDTNLPSNATLRTLFDDLVFKLNRDFKIIMTYFILGKTLSEPDVLHLKVGMNEWCEWATCAILYRGWFYIFKQRLDLTPNFVFNKWEGQISQKLPLPLIRSD